VGDRLIRKIPDGAPNLVTARRIAPTDTPRRTNDQCLHCGSGLASGGDAQFDGTEQAGFDFGHVPDPAEVQLDAAAFSKQGCRSVELFLIGGGAGEITCHGPVISMRAVAWAGSAAFTGGMVVSPLPPKTTKTDPAAGRRSFNFTPPGTFSAS
jgi:hypothetical protein